ncbi:hypothetical protein GWK47_010973 [Chionoecetes opilio]|uniref:Uncharacterized protein n=1 Tax=Chionoecetes opilio TaxID=41210 RepID=A0A8J5CMH3_CHIOP|nr:hypothetical protein GWK47_010973 [Chionoecetes opilio]
MTCGRKYFSHLSDTEKQMAGIFSSQVSIKVWSAPCMASKRNCEKSFLLSLQTMLCLGKGVDPMSSINFAADAASLRCTLKQLIDECSTDGTHHPEGFPASHVFEREDDEMDCLDTYSLKDKVVEKIKVLTGIAVFEYPRVPETASR